MKPSLPSLPPSLTPVSAILPLLAKAREDEFPLSGNHFTGITLTQENLDQLSFKDCLFEDCRFEKCSLQKTFFTNVIFKSCDFSNCDFTDAHFSRCHWNNSKAFGTNFAGCYCKKVTCTNCNMQLARFFTVTLLQCQFSFCNLSNTELINCKLSQTGFEDCRLTATYFGGTLLQGIDFSSCDISGLSVPLECKELKGAEFTLMQAAELAALLGIKIV